MIKKTLILTTLMLLLVFTVTAGSEAFAGTPHTVFGKIFNAESISVPADTSIIFYAHVVDRPNEVLTDSSDNCGYGSGYWYINAGEFPTPWIPGDVLHVDVGDTTIGEMGALEVTMTDSAVDEAADLYLIEGIIPVELASFNAVVKQGQVILTWSTKTEMNNFGFEVERSTSPDSSDSWQKIGFVEGHGTCTIHHDYCYTDDQINDGTYYYRLKQTDFDGSFELSKIKSVEVVIPLTFKLCQNYPNPFNPETKINFTLGTPGRVTLNVFNSNGQLVKTLVNREMPAGSHNINFVADKLTSGVYFYCITISGDKKITAVKKMVLMK